MMKQSSSLAAAALIAGALILSSPATAQQDAARPQPQDIGAEPRRRSVLRSTFLASCSASFLKRSSRANRGVSRRILSSCLSATLRLATSPYV
jgi:hypothetical protein